MERSEKALLFASLSFFAFIDSSFRFCKLDGAAVLCALLANTASLFVGGFILSNLPI